MLNAISGEKHHRFSPEVEKLYIVYLYSMKYLPCTLGFKGLGTHPDCTSTAQALGD